MQGLYKGFSVTIVRESTYSTIRLGMYEPCKNLLGGTDPKNTPIFVKMLAGSISGSIGSLLANPTDVLKVRMQAWEGKPKSLRWHASVLYDNWGWRGFYVGLKPTVIRAMLLNST